MGDVEWLTEGDGWLAGRIRIGGPCTAGVGSRSHGGCESVPLPNEPVAREWVAMQAGCACHVIMKRTGVWTAHRAHKEGVRIAHCPFPTGLTSCNSAVLIAAQGS